MEGFFRKKSFLFLGGLIVISDQLSKILIRLYGGFYICNQYIAFGLKIPEIMFWIFWTGIIFLILYFLYKKYFIHNTLYIVLILSGAFSNLLDRVQYGCIIDFINLGWGPIFNLADFFISLGAIMLIITYLKIKR